MADAVIEIDKTCVLALDPAGETLSRIGDVSDLISAAWEHEASIVILPVERVDPGFFVLSSGMAGEVIQKFVNYQIRLVVLGDIAAAVASSSALRDFIYESNQGRHVWFVADLAELMRKLGAG